MRTTTGSRWIRVTGSLLVALLAISSLTGCSPSRPSTTASTPSTRDLGVSSPSSDTAAKSSVGAPAASQSAIAPAPSGSGPNASTVPAVQRLIVRNKTLRLEVKDVSGTIDKLRALAKSSKADITDMQVATATDAPIYRPLASDIGNGTNSAASSTALNAYLTVRVPAADFERFIDEASKLGRILYQSESSDDVTQQHVDMAARLANLRAEETRLRDFLNAAHNVQEMLAVETELNRVRGEIESMSAQLAYIERQAALATVTIELTEPQAIVRPVGTDWGWGQAFTDAIRAFVNVVEGIIVVSGALLPLLLLALAAFLIIRAIVRHGRRRKAVAAETAAVGDDARPAGPGDASDAPSPDTSSEG